MMYRNNMKFQNLKKFNGTATLSTNVLSALEMADVIRTTLGPMGLDKLLTDEFGKHTITNDGYTALISLKSDNPIGKLLVEIAEMQQMTVGDGTTSSVIMASEMLKEGYRMISEYGIHPTKIIREIDEGFDLIKEYLNKHTVKINSLGDKNLYKVIETATASKLDGRIIANIIINAIQILDKNSRSDIRHGIILLRRLGNDRIIDGIAIEHTPLNPMVVYKIKNPVVSIIKDTLKLPLKNNEDDDRELIVSSLEENRINVILTNATGIDIGLTMYAENNGIAIINCTTEELNLLSKTLGLKQIHSTDLLSKQNLPTVEMKEIKVEEDDEITILRNYKNPHAATIIIGGVTDETSKERMRTCTDGISAAHLAIDGGVIPGGGIAELNAARYLKKFMTENNIEKSGFNVLIAGLESVSRQILDNAGYNGYEILVDLNTQPDGVGVNIESGDYIDMQSNGVLDSLIIKLSSINAAIHVTKTILKIDKDIFIEQKKS